MHVTRVGWTELKVFLLEGKIPHRVQDGNAHIINVSVNGSIGYETILRSGKNDAEITEYETLFSAIENTIDPAIVVRKLSSDSSVINPRAILISAASKKEPDDPHIFDKELISSTGLIALRGGWFWTDPVTWTFGDYVMADIIDKTNVIGLGGTEQDPTILSQYLKDKEFYLMPGNQELIDESISDPLPNGLFLRLRYYQAAAAELGPKSILNLMCYEV